MSFNRDRAITARFFAHDPMLHVSSCFYTLQGEGQFIGHPAVFLRLAGCNFGAKDPNGFCPFCFPSEASITTPFGKRKFSDVEVGDQLYTLSPEGEVVLTTVQRTLNRVVPQDELISIRYTLPGTKSVKTVVCTREHPFNTTRGFIPAGKLKLSDVIYHAEGNALKAVSKTVNNGMFVRNGAQIVSLKPVTRQQYENLGGTSAGIEVTNFSCAPYNTFLVGGLHTHNCDTSFQIDRAKKLTPEHTADLVCDVLGGSSAELLVITGGEPTLQHNIVQVLRILHERNMFSMFQFETNGTNPAFLQHIENLPAELRSKVTFCVSPKASYKTKEYARINPRMWSMLAASRGFVKFVVSADPDSPHHKLPEWVSELAEDFIPVYVSPMTVYKREPQGEVSSVWNRELVDHEATAKNYEYAAAYVMSQSGLLFTCQTHLFTAIP